MTYKCFIQLREEEISLYEIKSTGLILLKKDGEKSHKYKKTEFWNWWKKKFNYNGEKVIFIISTDKQEFEIPEYINISDDIKLNRSEIEEIDNKISPTLSIITYPKSNILTANKNNEKQHGKNRKQPQPKKGSIADYFQSKTQVIDRY